MIIVASFGALAAALSLGGFFGEWVWWLDILANFRAQFVIVLAALGAITVLTKWRQAGYGILLVAMINVIVIMPLYAGSRGGAGAGAPSMRVMSFNLQSQNDEYARVIEYIESIDADIVLLHEASRPWEAAVESADLGYEIIMPRTDDLVFASLVLVKGSGVLGVSYGFGETQARGVEVTFTPPAWPEPVKVLAAHPLAPWGERRAKIRDAQIGFAADWAEDQNGSFMVAGDLNATPWSAPFRALAGTNGLRNSQIGFGIQPSFPAGISFFRVPIDHLLHSETLVVSDRRLGPAMGSDHFPLVVDLQHNGG